MNNNNRKPIEGVCPICNKDIKPTCPTCDGPLVCLYGHNPSGFYLACKRTVSLSDSENCPNATGAFKTPEEAWGYLILDKHRHAVEPDNGVVVPYEVTINSTPHHGDTGLATINIIEAKGYVRAINFHSIHEICEYVKDREEENPDEAYTCSKKDVEVTAEFIKNAPANIKSLKAALEGMLAMHDYLCKKINWKASFIDAAAISLMNDKPIEARKALEALGLMPKAFNEAIIKTEGE